MQFIGHGPDIPNELLQAHEEGNAVFFCGAGISYPAGLPNFKGLVDDIYARLGTNHNEIENQAYERDQYDITLNLLEHRYPGGRFAVRKELAKSLQPKLRRRQATVTHTALLHLARDRKGSLRLVTTNFDRIFELVRKRIKQSYESYAAPTLPVPKASRWNGVVYLHGLLPLQIDESALNRLVVTSGDFGLAYLTERWAARFVSDLFRNYVVCFVGYSINDPVLRYMMDAIAADRMLGEKTTQAYALVSYKPGEETSKSIAWKSKGVEPILYEVSTGKNGHSALHQTLKAWADTYRDGILGKERIVVDYAHIQPSKSTQQDDFVGRMLWALSDSSGQPAKRFANLNPAPPIEWLMAFSEKRFRHHDLNKFGISPCTQFDSEQKFSLISRPAPYNQAPWMELAGNTLPTQWDKPMNHIANWLTRHLNDPLLIYWLLENGVQLYDHWSRFIEFKLDQLARFECEGNNSELEEIRVNSPNAIPNKSMQILWRLILSGRVKLHQSKRNSHIWKNRLKRDGLTASLRMELREILSPVIELRKPYRSPNDVVLGNSSSEHIRHLVEWELVLTEDHVKSTIGKWADKDKNWKSALPALLDDFQQMLSDALDLMRELSDTNEPYDYSYIHLRSISPHWQNRGHKDWTTLIELLRDAWLAVKSDNPKRANKIGKRWFKVPHPTFKRLAFFAASHDNCIDSDRWVEWLLCDEAWWLWSVETQREVLRLLSLQGNRLSSSSQRRLENAILAGLPEDKFRNDLEDERWNMVVERSLWLRLVKLDASKLNLEDAARNRLNALSTAHSSWQLLPHEREEFPLWTYRTGDPDFEESLELDIAPQKRDELVEWLKNSPNQQHPFIEDIWSNICRTEFSLCLDALSDLVIDDLWPAARWRQALQVWSKETQLQQMWCHVVPLVEKMPEDVLCEIAFSVAWWLDAVSKSIEKYEDDLFALCSRLLNLYVEPRSGMTQEGELNQSPVTAAINHPVGLVTQALLSLWFIQKPNDNDQLPTKLAHLFTQLCDIQVHPYRHGRVILASRLIALYRVDQSWTEQHLLPIFRWDDYPMEAQIAWQGFLWSPRLYQPLLIAFKPQFLETANHYKKLGELGQQYAAILTYAALENSNGDEMAEFQFVFETLPQDGLEEAARTLKQAVESAGEQSEDYWTNRIQPFWMNVWPKSKNLESDSIAESLALMCIATGAKFANSLDSVYAWLKPIEHPYHVLGQLNENNLCKLFPDAALRLLSVIIQNQQWSLPELGQCLTTISQEIPEIKCDSRYQRLTGFASEFDPN